jgi:hypothetical protein
MRKFVCKQIPVTNMYRGSGSSLLFTELANSDWMIWKQTCIIKTKRIKKSLKAVFKLSRHNIFRHHLYNLFKYMYIIQVLSRGFIKVITGRKLNIYNLILFARN